MPEQLDLFILEDRDSTIQLYTDCVNALNNTRTDVEIIPIFAKTLEEGQKTIRSKAFDAAIIDLKLRGDSRDLEGQNVIREIKEKLRFPVYIMSDIPDQLEVDLQEENCFYKIYHSTTKDTTELLKEITILFKTGITNILGKKGIIEKKLQEIFWKHLAGSMDCWKDNGNEKILSRHVTAYLHEYLQLNDLGKFDEYHEEEAYIIPPVRAEKHTGDILVKDEKFFIILSPSCAMANGKAKFITLAEIEAIKIPQITDQIIIIKEQASSSKQKESAIAKIDRLLNNSDSLNYHFLPPSAKFVGGFINFQKISSATPEILNSDFEVRGRVAEDFLKDIIARFSTYYARQGQPEFNIDKIREKLIT